MLAFPFPPVGGYVGITLLQPKPGAQFWCGNEINLPAGSTAAAPR